MSELMWTQLNMDDVLRDKKIQEAEKAAEAQRILEEGDAWNTWYEESAE